ncbi:hypothetical protein JY421_03575 [Stenotrophomonas maltophilia]|uniref:hypothetical protein n=1 Tax=Stenotrophomonas maltophilia TaxID=40324 RepID=UPI001D3DF84D|nr:hypothetical protein [Stenotrophomonas maltophilia]MBN5007952.1 hypothetical protein [Stenotrophomonas maltophilia]
MAQQVIDTTTDHGTYKGDPAKVAFEKVNANDAELYALVAGLAGVGGANMLINCGVPINQRGFAGGALAAGAYGYDRWKVGPGGGNVVIDPATGQFNHSSGPLVQAIESPAWAWGQSLFVSVENPSGPVQVSVGGSTGTITAGSGRRGVQVNPSGSGHMVVQLTATGVTYSRPKLERGSAPSTFEIVPIAIELAACKRYFEKSYNADVAPGSVSVMGARRASLLTGYIMTAPTVCFEVKKRVAPTLVLYAPTNGVVGNYSEYDQSGLLVAGRQIAATNVSQSSFDFINPAGTGIAGNTAAIHFTADSEI